MYPPALDGWPLHETVCPTLGNSDVASTLEQAPTVSVTPFPFASLTTKPLLVTEAMVPHPELESFPLKHENPEEAPFEPAADGYPNLAVQIFENGSITWSL